MVITHKEGRVIDLIVDGHNNESIANQLGISRETAKKHLSNIYKKFGCNTRLKLAVLVLKRRSLDETFDFQSN